MTDLRYPAAFCLVSAQEAGELYGGAESTGFAAFLDNVGKLSKIFNYMARIFSSTSAMLNNFLSVYNSIQQLNEYIEKNF